MKKFIYSIATVAVALSMSSCNDSFMDQYPDTELTESTVFRGVL